MQQGYESAIARERERIANYWPPGLAEADGEGEAEAPPPAPPLLFVLLLLLLLFLEDLLEELEDFLLELLLMPPPLPVPVDFADVLVEVVELAVSVRLAQETTSPAAASSVREEIKVFFIGVRFGLTTDESRLFVPLRVGKLKIHGLRCFSAMSTNVATLSPGTATTSPPATCAGSHVSGGKLWRCSSFSMPIVIFQFDQRTATCAGELSLIRVHNRKGHVSADFFVTSEIGRKSKTRYCWPAIVTEPLSLTSSNAGRSTAFLLSILNGGNGRIGDEPTCDSNG